MIEWLLQNKEWIFGGVGVSLLGALFTWLFKNERLGGAIKQQLNSDNYSNPIQAGRDINISIAKNPTNQQKIIKMLLAALDKNSRIVDALKAQYDGITKPSIDYMPKYFLDLFFLRNMMEQIYEFLENLPSSELISEAISGLFTLERNLETLRSTAERELVKSQNYRIYQQEIIFQCKGQLNITQSLLREAIEILSEKS